MPDLDPPADGFAGWSRHWRQDVRAGFAVALLGLPLCLGISVASGFPPVAGLITAIVGGLVVSHLGSSPMTIKGPAAGLIVVVLGAVTELGRGDPAAGYRATLAVGVAAAVLQIVLARLRAGELAELFPSSVLQGMLAAIGVTIVARQAHVLLGAQPTSGQPLALLAELPASLANAHLPALLVGAVSLALLWIWPGLPAALAGRVPAALAVLVVASGLGGALGQAPPGSPWSVGPSFFLQLPTHLGGVFTAPDLSLLGSATAAKYVLMLSIIGTLETLLSARAVEAQDPWRRRPDPSRDLLSVGVGNLVSACLGGLPMISEIVRSSANLQAGARTSGANLAHGAFLLLFVTVLPPVLRFLPLPALAAMLVYAGVRLASPRAFRDAVQVGPDQGAVFGVTLVTTLATDLLVGVAVGVLVKAVLYLAFGAPLPSLVRPRIAVEEGPGGTVVRVEGSAVFANYLSLRRAIAPALAAGRSVVVDLSGAVVVDHTTLERLHALQSGREAEPPRVSIRGLDRHTPLSDHPRAARRLLRAA